MADAGPKVAAAVGDAARPRSVGAAAWPLAANAQSGQRMRRIGVIQAGREDNPEIQSRIAALRDGLKTLGWIESRNYQFEYRWPGTDPERTRALVVDLVRAAPDIIVVGNSLSALALRKETTTIPLVFVNLADPVGVGLIASLSRTGGNITGLTDQLTKEGLVARTDDPDDRRSYRVALTPRGRAEFAAMAAEHEAWLRGMFQNLAVGDKQQLFDQLGRLRLHLARHQAALEAAPGASARPPVSTRRKPTP